MAQTPEILCSGLLSFNDLSLALTLAADPLALDRHTLWEKLTTFPPLPDPRAHTAEGVTSDLAAIPQPLHSEWSGRAGASWCCEAAGAQSSTGMTSSLHPVLREAGFSSS